MDSVVLKEGLNKEVLLQHCFVSTTDKVFLFGGIRVVGVTQGKIR